MIDRIVIPRIASAACHCCFPPLGTLAADDETSPGSPTTAAARSPIRSRSRAKPSNGAAPARTAWPTARRAGVVHQRQALRSLRRHAQAGLGRRQGNAAARRRPIRRRLEAQPAGRQRPLRRADGSWYEGQWKEGQPHGHGQYRTPDGRLFSGTWENGVYEGDMEDDNPNKT